MRRKLDRGWRPLLELIYVRTVFSPYRLAGDHGGGKSTFARTVSELTGYCLFMTGNISCTLAGKLNPALRQLIRISDMLGGLAAGSAAGAASSMITIDCIYENEN